MADDAIERDTVAMMKAFNRYMATREPVKHGEATRAILLAAFKYGWTLESETR